jgi:hypothetical protein
MRYIEVSGEINDRNQLILDESLEVIKPQQVKIDIWFRDEDEEEYHEETNAEILAGIREGLHECLTGETESIDDMWDDLRIKTTGTINDIGQLILDEPLKQTQAQSVDVVIWFAKNRQSEDMERIMCETSTRELIGSEV